MPMTLSVRVDSFKGRMIWDGKSQFSGAWFQFFGDNEEKLNEFISLAEREYLAYTQYAIG